MADQQKFVLRGLEKEDLAQAALVYGRAFEEPWAEAALLDLLKMKGAFGYCLTDAQEQSLAGFVLATSLFETAEILTIAVDPKHQGKGLALALMQAAEAFALQQEAEVMLLEVAEDNDPARRLYDKLGYQEISRRKGYYRRAGGVRVDAFNMSKALG